MSQKLWIAHETPAKTFGPTRVSIDGCEYVDDFLEEIKKKFALSVPSSHLTLYTSDGITEIDVGDSPSLLVDGNSRGNPLIVRSTSIEKGQISAIKQTVQPDTVDLHIYTPRATTKFETIIVEIKSGKINVESLLKFKRWKALYFLEPKALLQYDKDGWSFNDAFISGNVYKLCYEIEDGYDESNIRMKRRTKWQVSTLGQLSYDPNSTLFQLDSNYLAKTGLPTKNLILYCRQTFHNQFTFLRERVINHGVFGWILGPPGTGKSTTTLAFASTLDKKDWIVTWIHLSRFQNPVCVRLEGDSKKSQEIYDSNIDELFDILHVVNDSRQHIVFIDGYALNGDKHIGIQKACYSWLKDDREKRRLVVVCSMSSRYKAKPEEDMEMNIEEFDVFSWKEEEYLLAVRNDEFFNNVKAALDSDLQIDASATPEDLIRSKLYFAGASARWMFHFPTTTIIEQTEDSVAAVDNIMPYIRGALGYESNNVVNRLFSASLAEHDMFPRKTSIVSRFAGVQLAIKGGPDLIRNLAEATRLDGNPSMDGWMLEMWFFASLCHGGVKLFDKNNEELQTWPESDVKTLDITSFPFIPDDGVWFKPSKWNQGGFDAIFLEKGKGLVKFVQVTGGNTHSFKIEYFLSFLQALKQSPRSFEVKCLEILFVVDQKKSSTFKLAKPSVLGKLKAYGWKSGEEESKAKIVFIKGWCD